jgi:hypothetical protein
MRYYELGERTLLCKYSGNYMAEGIRLCAHVRSLVHVYIYELLLSITQSGRFSYFLMYWTSVNTGSRYV